MVKKSHCLKKSENCERKQERERENRKFLTVAVIQMLSVTEHNIL